MKKIKSTVSLRGRAIIEDTARGIADGFTRREITQAHKKYARIHKIKKRLHISSAFVLI